MSPSIQTHLSTQDTVLKEIIAQVDLATIESTRNVFHDLMSCIIEQQIHYRSAKKMFEKMLQKASLEMLTVANFETFEEKAFQNVKLSTRKYETIERILAFFQEKQANFLEMEDEAVREHLSAIKGVGTWTIDMILLYTLERANIFPADDYHLKKIMRQSYRLDDSKPLKSQMRTIAEKWAPFKSFGVKYLLAWKDFNQSKKL